MVTPYANCYSDGDNRAPGNIMPVTNLLERLFLEERRRTRTIPHAFGERAVLKLMYAAIQRASQTWQRIAITDFERKQLQTLREELNQNFDTKHKPIHHTSHSEISSRKGT
jgi:transposase-like protein